MSVAPSTTAANVATVGDVGFGDLERLRGRLQHLEADLRRREDAAGYCCYDAARAGFNRRCGACEVRIEHMRQEMRGLYREMRGLLQHPPRAPSPHNPSHNRRRHAGVTAQSYAGAAGAAAARLADFICVEYSTSSAFGPHRTRPTGGGHPSSSSSCSDTDLGLGVM